MGYLWLDRNVSSSEEVGKLGVSLLPGPLPSWGQKPGQRVVGRLWPHSSGR